MDPVRFEISVQAALALFMGERTPRRNRPIECRDRLVDRVRRSCDQHHPLWTSCLVTVCDIPIMRITPTEMSMRQFYPDEPPQWLTITDSWSEPDGDDDLYS